MKNFEVVLVGISGQTPGSAKALSNFITSDCLL